MMLNNIIHYPKAERGISIYRIVVLEQSIVEPQTKFSKKTTIAG